MYAIRSYYVIRVLVVEDSPTTRALLVRLFRDDPDIDVAGEAKDGLEAIELARRLRPDVIVMDRITSYNVCYTKLLRVLPDDKEFFAGNHLIRL